MKLTTEQFIEKAKNIHGDKYSYEKTEYINSKTKICITCTEHGDFWITPNAHLSQKQGCKKCGYNKNRQKSIYPQEEWEYKANLIHNSKYRYGIYKGQNKLINIVCPIHGEFKQKAQDHIKGCGCPYCGGKTLLNTAQFIDKSDSVHLDKYDYSKVNYINSHTKVCIICPIHGEFYQLPYKHLQGQGCPICKQSHNEQKIKQILLDNNIRFIEQKTFDWLKYKNNLYLDFYLPDYNFSIECQGEQHFKPIDIFGGNLKFKKRIERDKYKLYLTSNRNIKIIYYIEEQLLKYLKDNMFSFYENCNIITKPNNIINYLN